MSCPGLYLRSKIALRLITLSSIAVSFGHCGEFQTPEVLDGAFIRNNLRAVSLILPDDRAAADAQTVFLWTRRASANYRFELAADPNFEDMRITQNVANEAASWSDVASDDFPAGRYYWRIVTRTSAKSKASESRMLYVRDTGRLYVDSASTAEDEVGNRTAPYKSISLAIRVALQLRDINPQEHIDIILAGGSYTDDFAELRSGMSLLGGYNPQTWQRDPSNHPTILHDVIVSTEADVTDQTVVDGIQFEFEASVNPIRLSGSPIVSNNRLIGLNGIQIESGAPHIHNNDISATDAQTVNTVAGIQCAGDSDATIEYNRIQAFNSAGINVFGIQITAGRALIQHNIIKGEIGVSPFAFGNGIDIRAGSGSEGRHNTAAGTEAALGVYVPVSVVDANIFFIVDSGANADYPVYEFTADGDIDVFTNNFLFDAPQALYYDENSVDINSAAALSGLTDSSQVSGNLAPYGGGAHGNATAVFAAGFDYDDLTTWHIKAGGPADLDGGGYNEGDPGADAAATGPDW